MFSNLYFSIEVNIQEIYSIKLLFTLNEKRILPSKKCAKILKKYYFGKLKNFIKETLRRNKGEILKNQILAKWCLNINNYFKIKNNIYKEVKKLLEECLLLMDI